MKHYLKIVVVLALFALVLSAMPLSTDAQGDAQTHVVQSGENLFRIALRYGLTVDQLASANQIADPSQIYVGQILNIPDGSAPSEAAPAEENGEAPVEVAEPEPATAPIYHIVEAGQSLASIGQQYGVTWNDLAGWNNITDPNTIFAGQRLVVNVEAAPDSPAVAGPTIVDAEPIADVTENEMPIRTHTVQPGERLASIARDYGISWTTIARANNIENPNTIFAGQVLNIPSQDDATGTYLEPNGGVPSAPAPTSSTGKLIMINLSTQQVFAYENGQLLKTVTVSTGLPGTPTVTGNYRVYWKLSSQTMSGPGYYLPGVPYVMYFFKGYALHGTYWHNNFGQPMSHGCVNLPTNDALWFFNWAEIGTQVNVSY